MTSVGDISLTLRVNVDGIDVEIRVEWNTFPECIQRDVDAILLGTGPQTLYDKWNNIQTGGIKHDR